MGLSSARQGGPIPSHSHALIAASDQATSSSIAGGVLAAPTSVDLYRVGAAASAMSASAIGSTGGNQPHDNMMPSLCLSFIISLYGIFPSQT
jgi:microcystin-dependent protein